MIVGIVGNHEEGYVEHAVGLLLDSESLIGNDEMEENGCFTGEITLSGGLQGDIELRLGKDKETSLVVYCCGTAIPEEILNASPSSKQPAFALLVEDPDTVPEDLYDNKWFLGAFGYDEIESVLWSLYHAANCPAHVLWDRPRINYTAAGRRAIVRLFWFFDSDMDGVLNQSEISNLFKHITNKQNTELHEQVKRTLEQVEDSQKDLAIKDFTKNGNLTQSGLLSLCEGWLSDGGAEDYWTNLEGLWRALEYSGLGNNGNPWSAHDLSSLSLDAEAGEMVQLSSTAVQFLTQVYNEKFSNPHEMWKFTPATSETSAGETPWAYIPCLPGSKEQPAEYTCEMFISSWRFLSTIKFQHLVVFARCWGFPQHEDPKVLFIKKKKRQFREQEEDLPNVLQCLILGSPKCGKSALRQRLLSGTPPSEEESYSPTTTHSVTLVPINTDEGFDLVLHEIPDKEVATLLKNEKFMSRIDSILLCYDADDVYSFSYIAEKYPLIVKHTKLPVCFINYSFSVWAK